MDKIAETLEKPLTYLEALVQHLVEHPIGIILYIGGAITMTLIHYVNRVDIKEGFKGTDKLWAYPEWLMYTFSWIWPHAIMADQYLGLHMGEYAWYFMYILLLFGLTGTFGLRWLLAFKSGKQDVVEETTVTVEKKTQTQTNQT